MRKKIIGVTVGTNINPKCLEEYVQDGKSAYELAVENGFKGTEKEWLASLNGKDGYTPIKGVDYFDGKDGENGTDGKDGYTPVKGVDYFDGKNGADGKDGKNGIDGYTPIKGEDYFTEEDVQDIAERAAEMVDIPEGGVTSWDDLEDKPFGGTPPLFDITWDGNMEGHEVFDYGDGGYDVKVSDEVFTKEQLLNSTIVYSDGAESINTEENVYVDDEYGIITLDGCMIVVNAEKLNSTAGLPEGTYSNGVWFYNWAGEEPYYTNKLVAAHTIKTIDEKYIPDTIATKEYVDEATANTDKEVSWNDITDKPFGEETQYSLAVTSDTTTSNSVTIPFTAVVGKTYKIDVIDVGSNTVLISSIAVCTTFPTMPNYYVMTGTGIGANSSTNISWTFSTNVAVGQSKIFKVYEVNTSLITLDEKYIPDTIARASDVPTSYNDLTDVPVKETITTMFTEKSFTITGNQTQLISTRPSDTSLNLIIFDGQEYSVTAIRETLRFIYGNGSLISSMYEDNGMPFALIYDTMVQQTTVYASAGTHTIGAYKRELVFLNEKFLPDVVVLESELEAKGYQTEEQVKALINEGGGGGVTSWNELKDKPFYEETEIAELVSNLTTEAYNNGQFPPCNFIVGEKYNVIWNNESYNDLICYELDGYRVIGGEGYPFYIDDDGGNALFIESTTDETDFVVTIIGKRVTIKTIDEKFLPAWDDLRNKPFGEIPPAFDITWDGNMEGHEVVDDGEGGYIVKVSDEIFTKEQLINSTTFYSDGHIETNTEDNVFVNNEVGIISLGFGAVIFSAETFNSVTGLPEGTFSNGVWLNYQTGEDTRYVNRLVAATTIKKIDKEYLPDTEVSWNDLTDKPFGDGSISWEKCATAVQNISSSDNGVLKLWQVYIQQFVPQIGIRYKIEVINTMTNSVVASNTAICVDSSTTFFTGSAIGNSNDPVYISWTMPNTYAIAFFTAQGYMSFRVNVYQEVETITTLDEKYIPDTIARVSDIPSTDDFATKQYVDEAIENTEVSWNDITDKPFYDNSYDIEVANINSSTVDFTFAPNTIGFETGKQYRFEVRLEFKSGTWSEQQATAVATSSTSVSFTEKGWSLSYLLNGTSMLYYLDTPYGTSINADLASANCKIFKFSTELVFLNEKFLPEVVVLESELEAKGYQTQEQVKALINEGGSGGVTSWNDLQDKPFEYIPPLFDIQWDGDATGRQTISYNTGYYVKVSDEVFTKEQLVNSLMYYSYDDTVLNEESDLYVEDKYGTINLFVADAIVIYSAEDYIEASGLPEGSVSNGVWFWHTNGGDYVNRLVAPSTLKTLDEKFIPESVVLESELESKGYQTEEQVTELINNALGVIENGTY